MDPRVRGVLGVQRAAPRALRDLEQALAVLATQALAVLATQALVVLATRALAALATRALVG